jgi:hypothetical protein
MPDYDDLARVVSITSLDVAGQSSGALAGKPGPDR